MVMSSSGYRLSIEEKDGNSRAIVALTQVSGNRSAYEI
ncbi:hypothetical protein ACPOL_5770 [Acidisarcina polymorpha]|uniref:Uncharacterized protein n=1 Tax=Acidisarcina polymorpha TaxID=2211140 RepID=A0A2Z5G8Y5_9BACT|nr:hypothetical protein ACPOL_5770 [Acidisarcina polymorpha]